MRVEINKGRFMNFGTGTRKAAALMALGIAALPSIAHADESLWIYTQGAETLPAGRTEMKVSDVWRSGKVDSDYSMHDIRLEAEHGVTDRLTVYGELIVFNHNYSTTNPDLQPFYDTQGGEGGRFNETQLAGFEVGAKYNILSPYSDPIGLSTSVSFDRRTRYRLDGAEIDQTAWEFQLFFQKNFLDNQLVLAFSPQIELENRTSPGVIEKEIALDIAAGASYRVAPSLYIGAEFRHQSDYLSPLDTATGEYDPELRPSNIGLFNLKFGSQYQNGNYFGPTVHYAQQEWWVTAGVLFQVAGGGGFSRDGRNWDEHERVHAGLIFGIEL